MITSNEPQRLSQVAEQIQIMDSKLCQLEESISSLTTRLAAVLSIPPDQKKPVNDTRVVQENLVLLADKIRAMHSRLLCAIDNINYITSAIEL